MKTIFTAEELSTFIRKSILVFMIVGVINAIMLFWTQCTKNAEISKVRTTANLNQAALTDLKNTVSTEAEADKKWREEFAKANSKSKIVIPKLIKPEAPPKGQPTPPIVIVIPSPPPIIKTEPIVKWAKPKPSATPWRWTWFQPNKPTPKKKK